MGQALRIRVEKKAVSRASQPVGPVGEARGIKGVLTGTSGIGKTTQLLTLDPQRTLFLNLEAGELAVQGWPGDEVRIRDWEGARDLAA
jgi:ABC-type transport system involved in cytochrome bd biosynthesis fused ATPase/permease subunit